MTAPDPRPNFLLIWIGVVVLLMSVGLRVLFPAPASLREREALGAPPAPPAPAVVEPDAPAKPPLPVADPLAPAADELGTLVDAPAPLHGLQPDADAAAVTPVSLAGKAGLIPAPGAPAQPTELPRIEPGTLHGSRPRPARVALETPAPTSNSAAPADFAPPMRVRFFGGAGLAAGAAAPIAEEPPPVEEILVVQVAPETFHAVVVLSEPTLVEEAPIPRREREVEEEAEPTEERAPDPGLLENERVRALLDRLEARMAARAREAGWAPQQLAQLRAELIQEVREAWLDHDPERRRVFLLELDRDGLARLLERLAARARA